MLLAGSIAIVDSMKVQKLAFAGVMAALFCSLAAIAQEWAVQAAPAGTRAQMEDVRLQAAKAAFNDLTPELRAKVESIVAQVRGGTLDGGEAAARIDSLLTPSELKGIVR